MGLRLRLRLNLNLDLNLNLAQYPTLYLALYRKPVEKPNPSSFRTLYGYKYPALKGLVCLASCGRT